MKKKCAQLTYEQKDLIVSLPRKLTSEDGRVFHIRQWKPVLVFDAIPSVTIEALISLPDNEETAGA